MFRIPELHNCIVLSEDEIQSYLWGIGWNAIINRVAETFVEEALGNTVSPPKVIVDIPEYKNDFRAMPARMLKYPDYCGMKLISACTPCPKKFHLPLARGIYILNDSETQSVLLMFDSNLTTAYRTAAASAVAVRELAKLDANVLGVIGCGQQAQFHIKAISAVRHIKETLVYDIDEACTLKMCEQLNPVWNIKQASKGDIFKNCDIIVTLTPTYEPHIFVNDLPNRDVVICAVGGDSEKKKELHYTVLGKTDNFCDSYEQVAHTGTMVDANEAAFGYSLHSLGELMIGKCGVDGNKRVKVFLSTGVALEDLALGIMLYEKVRDKI